jgi:Glycosyltransferase family 87
VALARRFVGTYDNHVARLQSHAALIVVTLALLAAALSLALHGNVERSSFKAFYCAGMAVDERADPYRVEPMRSCERRLAPSPLPDGYVEPAPIPGYAMAPFAALATLPPRLASLVYAFMLVLGAAIGAYVLGEILPAPRAAVLLAFAPLTLLNVAFGEVVPFALAAICLTAFLIWRGRWFGAGLAVCLALIQPNVGLPAVLATFFFAPRSRVAVALGVASLAFVSALAIGIDRNIEYLTQVLPGMANAEIVAADQYNLSHLLFAAGFTPSLALLLGKLWFGFVALLGILVAGVLAIRRRQPELLPLIPPACVLLFGIYLHDIQILLALPAALAVATRVRGATFQTLGAVAVALLVAVWTQRAGVAALTVNAVGVAAGLWALPAAKNRIGLTMLGTLSTVLCVFLLRHVAPAPVASDFVTQTFHAAAHDQAFNAWAAYLRETPALTAPAFPFKIPTWIGLLFVVLGAVRLCIQPGPRELDPATRVTPTLSGSREPQLANAQCSVFSQKYD